MKKDALPEFKPGELVKLDEQPFEWTVLQTNVDGLPQVVEIQRDGDELFPEITRKVDVMRLSRIEGRR